VRGLLLALTAVLIVMGFAFWRSTAGSGPPRDTRTNEGTEAPAASKATADSPPDGGSPAPNALDAVNVAGEHAAKDDSATPARPPAAPAHETDEARLMARLRAIKDSDPAAAVTMAREGNRRFPESTDAPERTSILIHALVAVDKGSEARGEAEQMVNHYPDSSWVREVERFTGAHRHRNVSVTDAGQLIFR